MDAIEVLVKQIKADKETYKKIVESNAKKGHYGSAIKYQTKIEALDDVLLIIKHIIDR